VEVKYAVAADDRQHTSLGYMRPVRQEGIPCIFIVGKDGKLLWHGHPEGGLGKTLEEILAGSYDLKGAEKAEVARTQMVQYLGLAQRRDPRTKAVGRVILARRTNDVALLCDLAFEIATTPRLMLRDVPLANEALDQAEKLSPTNTTRVTSTRAVLLFETGKKEEGITLARKAVAEAKSAHDKANAEFCLRSMEARMTPGPPNQGESASTNATQSPTGRPTIPASEGPRKD
jgi:hypothetical protein